MESRRWFNPSLPISLFAGTWLLYLGAGLALLFSITERSWGSFVAAVALVSAAYLTANARSIGWFVGMVTTAFQIATPFAALVSNLEDNLRPDLLAGVLLPALTLAALIHPASREYQRTWFS